MTGQTLGARLSRARQDRFVGRAAELELFRAALDGDAGWAVLFIHGPGGVGKTALVERMAAVAEEERVPVVRVDLRAIDRSPSGFLRALGDDAQRLATEPHVLILDTFELGAPLEAWLRDEFLPGLNAGCRVVIAGRDRPGPAWIADPGWSQLVRAIALRNLPPADAVALLRALGVPDDIHERVAELTHGHPLALALLADVVLQRGAVELGDAPDVVAMLLERFVAGVPSRRHREALQVCAHARVTTEDLLRAALGGEDTGELFAWLRGLSFVQEGPEGLFPHDLARDVLDADLRWRDADAYRDLHRRVRANVVARIHDTRGREQQRAENDLLFLHRANPAVRGFWDWSTLGEAHADGLRPGDAKAVLAMVERFEGPASAAIARHWLDHRPQDFVIFRAGDDPAPIGFALGLALDETTPEQRAADPGASAMWEFTQRHAPPRPGERVLAARMFMDAEAYQGPSRTLNAITARSTVTWMSTPRLSWDFIGAWADPDLIAPLMHHIEFARVPEADYEVGGRRYGVFAHDWRRMGIDEWLAELGEREIATEPPAPPDTAAGPDLALSREDFAAAVRAGLRDLHRPTALATNPLVRSGAVRDAADDDAAPQEVLEALLRQAVASVAADPRGDKLHRVLDRTYLRPAATQEHAAEVLGLPSSTYRRHLARAVERVTDWLWERELYGVR